MSYANFAAQWCYHNQLPVGALCPAPNRKLQMSKNNQGGEAKRRALLLDCGNGGEKVGANVSVTGTFAVILREITVEEGG